MRRYASIAILVFAAFGAATAWSAAGPAASARDAAVTRLSVSPPVISLGTGADDLPRETTVTFTLRRAGTVLFTLEQVAPRCATVGAFRVGGRAGDNRFLFPGRIDPRLLPPGTYHVSAPAGRGTAIRVAVVVAAHGADREELERAVDRDTCREVEAGEAGERRAAPARSGAREARDAEPFVIVCLGIAIGLLGIGALPLAATPGPRTAELLAARRPAVAVAGAVALGVSVGLYVTLLL